MQTQRTLFHYSGKRLTLVQATSLARVCIRALSLVSKRLVSPVILSLLFLVGCQGAAETLPAPPTAPVTVIRVVVTSAPTDLPPTALPSATATSAQAQPTPPPTSRPTRAPATATRVRSTASPAPAPTRPDTLLDGNYTSTGSVRIQFTVSGGTLVSGGFFNYRCPVDGALSTYGFTDPAAMVGGQFAFSALPAASSGPQVTMVCTAITLTQARCAIRNLLATQKCLDTPATANRK